MSQAKKDGVDSAISKYDGTFYFFLMIGSRRIMYLCIPVYDMSVFTAY